jgi:hypothetical protein
MSYNLATQRKYRRENPEPHRADNKRWRENHPEKVRKAHATWEKANPEKRKLYKRIGRYSLTEFEFNRLCDTQGFSCAICHRVPTDRTGKAKPLAVDHVHFTSSHNAKGKVRGLLCITCNLGLGAFRDSLDNLRFAMQYLLDTQTKQRNT